MSIFVVTRDRHASAVHPSVTLWPENANMEQNAGGNWGGKNKEGDLLDPIELYLDEAKRLLKFTPRLGRKTKVRIVVDRILD